MSSLHDAGPTLLRHQIGLFFVSCATLLLQVTWTRVLSVSLWYHFAFLIVSTALLGFGLSGVLLSTSRRLRALPLQRGLTFSAAALTVMIVAGFSLANRIPFSPFSLLVDPWQFLYAPLYLLCIGAPFVFSGLCAALLLGRYPERAGRIYCFDLCGASLGCFAVALIMPRFGGSGSVLICAALAALGLFCFCAGTARLVTAFGLVLLVGTTFASDFLLPLHISHTKTADGKTPMQEVLNNPANLYTAWNTFSRIDVLPSIWGREILIDAGTAMTRMPHVTEPPEEMGPIEDERGLALSPFLRPSVLIIGSGGGWDVLAALRSGAARVVAVEVNPLINRLVSGSMADYVGRIFSSPRVELQTAEARSFIRRSHERFDVIMASHTISNAATASGALSLAENYLLTLEAFADYLDHLTPAGALWITRPEFQLPRLVATAAEALRRRGTRSAAAHLIVFAGEEHPSFNGGLLLSIPPLSPQRVERAAAQLSSSKQRTLYLPGRDIGPNLYRQILLGDLSQRERLYQTTPTEIRPATDDKPFFNQRTRWSSLSLAGMLGVFHQDMQGRRALEDQPVGETVLIVALIQSSLFALLFILAPLIWRRREGLRGPACMFGYFFCLGLGFILCEIGLIQRLTLFLGEPVYTFAVVVGGLLFFSGVGSLASGRIAPDPKDLPRRLRAILWSATLALGLFALASPPLLRAGLHLPLAVRIALTLAMLLPIGLVLGMPFPLGLRRAGSDAPEAIPWTWGLNAIASVVGSVMAIILATAIGFTGVFLLAAGIYFIASILWTRWSRG